jgi:hypothetical protein
VLPTCDLSLAIYIVSIDRFRRAALFAASTILKHLICLRHKCAWKRDGRNSERTVRENRSGPRVAQTSSELCVEIRPDSRRRSYSPSLCEVRRHPDYGRTIRHDGEQSVSRVEVNGAPIRASSRRARQPGDGTQDENADTLHTTCE